VPTKGNCVDSEPRLMVET